MKLHPYLFNTILDTNATNLKSKSEFEFLIARVDLLITNRLFGSVLAIKNGVAVIPIDPEPGEAKIVHQNEKIGCPIVYTASSLSYGDFSHHHLKILKIFKNRLSAVIVLFKNHYA